MAFQQMNAEQQDVFDHIARNIDDQINGNKHRLRLFITGNAGTGKTFLLNQLRNQINERYGKEAVKVCAYTGVAALLVRGSTLHSTLKLTLQNGIQYLPKDFLSWMRCQWICIQFIIIDEVSLISYELLSAIDLQLKQLKKSDEFFGGINVLLFGDLLQLPPINGHQVFDRPRTSKSDTHLWRLFTLIELKENMRQQGDKDFVEILNALRIGELRSDDHFRILKSKMINKATGEFSVENAMRIYPKIEQVRNYNQAVIDYYRSTGVTIYKIEAIDELIDSNNNAQSIDIGKLIPSDTKETGNLSKVLQIFEGAKVMLRINLDVSLGLVNGAIGYITEILWRRFENGQIDVTAIPSVRIDFGEGCIRLIKSISYQFSAKCNYGTIKRTMLPIDLSWACTVHKMQGKTVEHAVVYLGPKLFAKGQAYVALSRVKSLDGLRIEELDWSVLCGKKPCNIKALDEMARMRSVIHKNFIN